MDEHLERRYEVKRIGGTPGKHDKCWFFVLDLRHDPHARTAFEAYIISIARYQPEFAKELIRKYAQEVSSS